MTKQQDILDAATTELNANADIEDSAGKAIDTLIQMFADTKGDPTAFNAALAAAKSKRDALAASIANVPSA